MVDEWEKLRKVLNGFQDENYVRDNSRGVAKKEEGRVRSKFS